MAEQRDTQTRIWCLSGTLAILGAAIALCAAIGFFAASLIAVGLGLVVTVRLGMVLAQADKKPTTMDKF